MILLSLPHILGVCCLFFCFILLLRLAQDIRGVRSATSLAACAAGILSFLCALVIVFAVDSIFPMGGTETQAALFVRVTFLIPLAYFAGFIASFAITALFGGRLPGDIIAHTTYLGITLTIFAPVAGLWLETVIRTQ